MLGNAIPTLTDAFVDCSRLCTPNVSVRTLRRWWTLYEEWGELPYKVAERKLTITRMDGNATKNQLLDDADTLALKQLVDSNPNLYLDKLAFLFSIKTAKYVHYSTIRWYLVDKLRYSMKVLQTVSRQQCEMDEIRFLTALGLLLQLCPERLITINETHKDRNVARRRRG